MRGEPEFCDGGFPFAVAFLPGPIAGPIAGPVAGMAAG